MEQLATNILHLAATATEMEINDWDASAIPADSGVVCSY